jgi:hypothetical protein
MWRALTLVAVLTACYPIHKTTREELRLRVLGAQSDTVPGAIVVLKATTYPYGRERTRDTLHTDSRGMAHFAQVKDWRMETLMIHGADVYFWNWCVSAPGYQTQETRWTSGERWVRDTVVRLVPGATHPCFLSSVPNPSAAPRTLPPAPPFHAPPLR